MIESTFDIKGNPISKEFWIKCDCDTHVINVKQDIEDNLIYFSIWQEGDERNQKLPFWYRIKMAFRIAFKGTLFSDQIVLNPDASDTLIQAVRECMDARRYEYDFDEYLKICKLWKPKKKGDGNETSIAK